MRLIFLGTGGYHPNERRHTSCIFLPESGVIFDAGTAFFRVDRFLQTQSLHVFLSHAHLDHIVGLTYFIIPVLQGRVRRISLHGRSEDLQAIREHLYAKPLFPVEPDFEFLPLTERIAIPGGGMVTHRSLVHPGGSTGYRVDWPGKSLAYITDTTADLSHVEFVRGVDLLIHECNFGDDMPDLATKTGHSCTTPVATLAREAGVGQLILTHIDPEFTGDDPVDIAAARRVFPATTYAEDLREIEF